MTTQQQEKIEQLSLAVDREKRRADKAEASNRALARENARLRERVLTDELGGLGANAAASLRAQVDELNTQVTAWQQATGHDTPDAFSQRISEGKRAVESAMGNMIEALKSEVDAWQQATGCELPGDAEQAMHESRMYIATIEESIQQIRDVVYRDALDGSGKDEPCAEIASFIDKMAQMNARLSSMQADEIRAWKAATGCETVEEFDQYRAVKVAARNERCLARVHLAGAQDRIATLEAELKAAQERSAELEALYAVQKNEGLLKLARDERDAAQARCAELETGHAATRRELERWKRWQQIEGDYVCENGDIARCPHAVERGLKTELATVTAERDGLVARHNALHHEMQNMVVSKPKYRVTVPLEGGREITVYLPKPASELSPVEVQEIVEALARQIRRRGQG